MGCTPSCSEASSFKAGTLDQLSWLRVFVVFLKPSRQMLDHYLKSCSDCFLPQPFTFSSLLVHHGPSWYCIIWATDCNNVLEKEISILYFILYSRGAQIFQLWATWTLWATNRYVKQVPFWIPTSVKCHWINCSQLGNLGFIYLCFNLTAGKAEQWKFIWYVWK
jgi:hypothetical protein